MNKITTMKNLKKIVKDKNKSLTSLAVELEISQEAISQYISGKIKPKLSTIIKMAQILNTSTDYLLDLTDDPVKNNTYDKINSNPKLRQLINDIANLNSEKQKLVDAYVQGLLEK